MGATTLITGGIVVCGDDAGTVITDGAVLVDGNCVADVGDTAAVATRHPAPDRILDAAGKIVAPGFVSSHNHLGFVLFRGMAEDVGATPTPTMFLPMRALVTTHERIVFARLGVLELLRGGVTTILAMEEDATAIAPVLVESGMRARIALMTNDVDVPSLLEGKTAFDPNLTRHALRQSEELIVQWPGGASERIGAMIGANMMLSCSDALLRGLGELAARHGVGVTCHVGLGNYEVELSHALYGKGPFALLRDVGFLESDCVAAHCHHVADDDLAILRKAKAAVAHCPVLSALRGAAAPVQRMIDEGLSVALGLDNYFADCFDAMRMYVSVARMRERDATLFRSRDALRAATLDAARALHMDDQIGSIEIGKKADIQLIDVTRPGIVPIIDPVGTLVYHAHAGDVSTVLIDGVVVLLDGRVIPIDEPTALEEGQRLGALAWHRFAAHYPEKLGVLQWTPDSIPNLSAAWRSTASGANH